MYQFVLYTDNVSVWYSTSPVTTVYANNVSDTAYGWSSTEHCFGGFRWMWLVTLQICKALCDVKFSQILSQGSGSKWSPWRWTRIRITNGHKINLRLASIWISGQNKLSHVRLYQYAVRAELILFGPMKIETHAAAQVLEQVLLLCKLYKNASSKTRWLILVFIPWYCPFNSITGWKKMRI